MKRHLPLLVVLCLTAALTGCGAKTVAGAPAERSYTGPLHVAPADAVHPRAGAAGDVVECRTWGNGGYAGKGEYGEGATAGSPAEALEVASSEGGFGGTSEGLRVARTVDDRVLYVLEVAGEYKQAVIVRDGPASEGAGGPGWYVESWAHCDYAELPRSFTDSLGLQVWRDSDGEPAPTTRIESWVGPEHCDWQAMTFLDLEGATYVRNPDPELSEWFEGEYVEHVALPADAVDTGLERDGERLWIARDEQTAYVGDEAGVEAWPRAVESLQCA